MPAIYDAQRKTASVARSEPRKKNHVVREYADVVVPADRERVRIEPIESTRMQTIDVGADRFAQEIEPTVRPALHIVRIEAIRGGHGRDRVDRPVGATHANQNRRRLPGEPEFV